MPAPRSSLRSTDCTAPVSKPLKVWHSSSAPESSTCTWKQIPTLCCSCRSVTSVERRLALAQLMMSSTAAAPMPPSRAIVSFKASANLGFCTMDGFSTRILMLPVAASTASAATLPALVPLLPTPLPRPVPRPVPRPMPRAKAPPTPTPTPTPTSTASRFSSFAMPQVSQVQSTSSAQSSGQSQKLSFTQLAGIAHPSGQSKTSGGKRRAGADEPETLLSRLRRRPGVVVSTGFSMPGRQGTDISQTIGHPKVSCRLSTSLARLAQSSASSISVLISPFNL
mmetsp:Transcript_85485/g.174434  ORF Transcript_85485/g.174434 Transcript_85485/m.174434 type:complete len:281 (-) Transcript_85485:231-1073(-)